jgi:hypothetical protein
MRFYKVAEKELQGIHKLSFLFCFPSRLLEKQEMQSQLKQQTLQTDSSRMANQLNR